MALDNGIYHYALEIQHPLTPPGKPFIRSETVTFDGEPQYRFSAGEATLFLLNVPPVVFPFTAERSFLESIDIQSQQRAPRLLALKRFLDGLWILQPNPFAMDMFSPQEQSWLARDGRNLASFFRYLNEERVEIRAQLDAQLREAIPGFKNFSLPRAGNQKALMASFSIANKVVDFSLEQLSEGQRVLILLYTALLGLWDTGAPLCFDEPDNFVSLTEIQPWLQLLSDTVASRGGQAMVISHHPEVMDYLAVDSVWVFDRPSGPVRVQPYQTDREPADEALKLSEIVARGIARAGAPSAVGSTRPRVASLLNRASSRRRATPVPSSIALPA